MASQFIHYEDYAQKADSYRKSTGFIFGEVSRQATMSDHIASSRPPVIVYGASVEEAKRFHNAKANEASIQVKGGRQRKIRADQKTLASIVISHPYLLEDAEQNPKMMAELRIYEQNSIDWLKDTFGNDLISVIRHDDEPHAHWHALILPLGDPEFKASKLHPGKAAKAKVMQDASLKTLDSKLLNKKGDMAYQAAMRAFQDSFYQKVSKPAGLTRLGPQVRRLTRAEWHLEKKQARALLEVKLETEAAKEKASKEIGPTESELSIAAAEEQAEAHDGRAAEADGMFVIDYFKAISEHQHQHQLDDNANANETLVVGEIEAAQLQGTDASQEQGTEQIVSTNAAPEVGDSASQVPTSMPEAKPSLPTYKRSAFDSDIEEGEEEDEKDRQRRQEYERLIDNKSYSLFELCKSPEADIFLQARAMFAGDVAEQAKNTQNEDRTRTVITAETPVGNVVRAEPTEREQADEIPSAHAHNPAGKLSQDTNRSKDVPAAAGSRGASDPRIEVKDNGTRQESGTPSPSYFNDGEKSDLGGDESSNAFQRQSYPPSKVVRTLAPTGHPAGEIETPQRVTDIPEPKPQAVPFGAGNAQIQPASDHRTNNVKEQPRTSEAQGIDRRSLAERFRDKLGAQRYKPRLSLDRPSIDLSPTSPRVQTTLEPDANPTQQPNVRYTRTYRPDSAKLGLPPGYDPLARFRRKQEPLPKPDQETPDNTPRPPTA
jgi:hypothetical protein